MRSFLEFKLEGIFSNIRGGRVTVSTDLSGGLVFLASITFMDFAKRIGKHVEIAESDISEDEKLHALYELWRDISPEIGGYLLGFSQIAWLFGGDEANPPDDLGEIDD